RQQPEDSQCRRKGDNRSQRYERLGGRDAQQARCPGDYEWREELERQVRLRHRVFGRIVAPTIGIVSLRTSVNQRIQIGRVNAFVTVGLRIRTVPLTASRVGEVELRGGGDQGNDGSCE